MSVDSTSASTVRDEIRYLHIDRDIIEVLCLVDDPGVCFCVSFFSLSYSPLVAFSVQSSISDGASASETDMEDASSNNAASMPPSTEGPFDRSNSITFNFQISI